MKRLTQFILAWVLASTIALAQVTISDAPFVGATAGAAGTTGNVPAPAAGQNTYFIRGDGTWVAVPGGGDLLKTNYFGEFTTVSDKINANSNIWATSYFDSYSRIAAQLGGVKLDGVTSGQGGTAFMGDWHPTTNEFSVSILFRANSGNPTTQAGLFSISSSSTASAAYGLSAGINTSGGMILEIYGSSTSNKRTYTYTNFCNTTNYGGRVVMVTWTRSAGTITTYVNGTDVSSLCGESTAGTPPATWAESIIGPYFHIGRMTAAQPYSDRIIRVAPFNKALTAAEVATLYNDGILAEQRWVSYHGGNAVLNIERNSAFAAAATDWTAAGTGSPTISAAGAIVFNAADDYVVLAATSVAQLTPGVLHKITFDVSGGTYGGNTATVGYGPSANNQTEVIGTITADGSYNFEFTPKHGLCAFNIIAVGGALNFTLDNVRVTKVLLTNGSFETAGSPLGSWTKAESGSSVVTRDTSVVHSGSASAALNVTNSAVYIQQSSVTTIGKKYQVRFWAKADTGTPQIKVESGTVTYGTFTLSTTWTEYTTNFTAASAVLIFNRSSSGNYIAYFDDVELIELGALDAWGPGGLDDLTTLWRSDNPSSGHDATLFNLTSRSDGTYQNIILGYGRGAGERGNLGRISRESGTMSLGGISLPGNANQRLTVATPSGATDITTNSYWVRAQVLAPSSNPSSTQGGLWTLTSSATAADAANSAKAVVNTSGALVITLFGSSTSNSRVATVANFVSMFGGRVVDVMVGRNALGSITVWINGSKTEVVETVAGTPPTWAGSTVATYQHVGVANTTVRWVGEYYRFQLGRGVLTDAMVRQVYNAGVGTGTGGAGTTTPISRGGVMASTDGVVIDLDLAVGNGYQYPDKSGNGYHALSNTRDETHKLPKNPFQIRGQTSTSGNQQLLGATCVSTNSYIESIVITSPHSGTPTVSLGTSSGVSNIVAAASIVAGKNFIPAASLQTRFSSTGNLWVNSSTTNVLNWTITLSNSD